MSTIVRRGTGKTGASNRDRQAKFRAERTKCTLSQPQDATRRANLEADPLAWSAWYLPHAFPTPFGRVHREIAAAFSDAVENGRWCVVAAPRGSGKTTLVNALALHAVLSGAIKFVAVVPWRRDGANKAIRFWRTALSSPILGADYPEICAPFVAGRGSSQRTAAIHWDHTDQPTGAQILASDGMIVLPDGHGVICSESLNGNPRGLQFTTSSGEVLRPQLVLIDDPSDKTTARSVLGTRQNVEFILEDVLGMAGPTSRIAAMMTCTRITAVDTASTFLNADRSPEWTRVSSGQIDAWPTDMELWEEWNELRLASPAGQYRQAREFYEAHRAEMLAGFAVSWEHRTDRKRGDPDAYWSAMFDYFAMGRKAFLQERQNLPEEEASGLYTITPEIVASRTNGCPRGKWPEDASHIVVGIDVNLFGLTWAVCGVGQNMACAVGEYGVYPGSGKPLWEEGSTEKPDQAVARGLSALIARLTATYSPEIIIVDGNFATPTVYAVCSTANRAGKCDVWPGRGISSRKYRLPGVANKMRVRRKCELCHTYQDDRGIQVYFDSHHWHRSLQEGFLVEPGTPGSVSMYGGPGTRHEDLATAVCADRLIRVDTGEDGREIHTWESDARYRNDIADAVTMCLVGANIMGASQHDFAQNLRKKRKTANDTPTSYAVTYRR